MALLEINNLSVEFSTDRGLVRAVQGVSLSVDKGQALGLVGESGSGKSVTGLSTARLVPEPPGKLTGGSIRFEGRDIVSMDRGELRQLRGRGIGFVFQDPLSALNPMMRVGDQVAEAVLAHERVGAREARERAVKALGDAGLPDAAERAAAYPHELSGGMRQRVMIAMATVLRPSLLIADEPTTALDVTVQAQIIKLFRRLREETGMALILISHDLGVVAQLADRVAVMRGGVVLEEQRTEDLLRRPREAYTRRLIEAIPRWKDADG